VSYSFGAARLGDLRDRAPCAPPSHSRLGWASLFSLGRADRRGYAPLMGFRVVSGTAIQEFVENVESATAALDRVRELIRWGLPNIQVLTEGGRICSLEDLEGPRSHTLRQQVAPLVEGFRPPSTRLPAERMSVVR
jgi:hypothetical protein